MSDSIAPEPAPQKAAQAVTQTVRTFKNRETAELAVERLKHSGIEATILELAAPPGRPALISDAVRVVVNSEDAARASKILLNQSREFVPGSTSESSRRKNRSIPTQKAGMPWLFLLLALGGAAGAVYFYADRFVGKKPVVTARSRDRYVNEDTNHDGRIDLKRFVSAAGNTVREEVDYDGDGNWDVRSLYSFGRLTRRSTDLDRNGIMDEETYYDRYGKPFYSQILMNGKGPVTKRTFFQEATDFADWEPTEEDPGPPEDPSQPGGGDNRPFRVLVDTDADGHFDLDQRLNLKGEVTSERALEKNALENQPPKFPD